MTPFARVHRAILSKDISKLKPILMIAKMIAFGIALNDRCGSLAVYAEGASHSHFSRERL